MQIGDVDGDASRRELLVTAAVVQAAQDIERAEIGDQLELTAAA